jgi:hypothetical protein
MRSAVSSSRLFDHAGACAQRFLTRSVRGAVVDDDDLAIDAFALEPTTRLLDTDCHRIFFIQAREDNRDFAGILLRRL